MTKQSKTYLESISDILWSIFPENATKINYYAQIYAVKMEQLFLPVV